MSGPIISVRGVRKTYRIYSHPAQMVVEAFTGRRRYREFLALEGINFDVHAGSVVGLMGRNGAGKSTLLRIIARTLDATAGTVTARGRISAILELGTGFHLDYTGRENIYFGGICLGLSRKEMQAKVDEIVDFSELGDFIDQPFRTYSSGMQARLTFAVATCVDPDILIVDEALAVGDAKFQLKSFDRIRDFKRRGKAILLVSHAINQITAFCDHAILLDHGRILASGAPNQVGNIYHELLFGPEEQELVLPPAPVPTAEAADTTVELDHAERQASLPSVAEAAPETETETACEFDDACADAVAPTTAALIDNEMLQPELDEETGGAGSLPSDSKIAIVESKKAPTPPDQAMMSFERTSPAVAPRPIAAVDGEPPCSVDDRTAERDDDALSAPVPMSSPREHRYGNGAAQIIAVAITDPRGKPQTRLRSLGMYEIRWRIRVHRPVSNLCFGILIRDERGLDLYGGDNEHLSQLRLGAPNAGDEINAKIKFRANLAGGLYFMTVSVANIDQTKYDIRFDAIEFVVEPTPGLHDTSLVNIEAQFELIEDEARLEPTVT